MTLTGSLLGSYKELGSAITKGVLSRHRSSTSFKSTPDAFPMVYPFTLISDLPPVSLLDKAPGDDGLTPPGTFVPGLAETATVIITLILATPRRNMINWMMEILDIEGLQYVTKTLKSIFDFCSSVIRFDAFPKQWLTLSLMCFRGILRLLDPIAEVLDREAFIPSVENADGFDVRLWMSCFALLCEICGSEELALEDHTQQRRRAEWIIAGDLRDEGAGLLLRLWNAVGWPANGESKAGSSMKYGGVSDVGCIRSRLISTVSNQVHKPCGQGIGFMPLESRSNV
jgi:dedicator of cytokinesis protein 3